MPWWLIMFLSCFSFSFSFPFPYACSMLIFYASSNPKPSTLFLFFLLPFTFWPCCYLPVGHKQDTIGQHESGLQVAPWSHQICDSRQEYDTQRPKRHEHAAEGRTGRRGRQLHHCGTEKKEEEERDRTGIFYLLNPSFSIFIYIGDITNDKTIVYVHRWSHTAPIHISPMLLYENGI